jgi:PAS domain S-box-containing protein
MAIPATAFNLWVDARRRKEEFRVRSLPMTFGHQALPPQSPAPIIPKPAAGTAASSGASRLLPILILISGWTVSVWMFVLLRNAALQREEEFFGERIAEAQAAIQVRMSHYVEALHGGSSFIAAAKSVDRDAWRVYAESLQMRTRYPGINGLGVILAVRPEGVEAWKDRVRVPGEPEPVVRPFPGTAEGPPADIKYLITYVEGNPVDRPPIGRNIATEPSRRRAAELARDTGRPQINHRIPGSRDTKRRAGLLLYAPLYEKGARLGTVAERRAAHLGWIHAQVFPDVFLDGVLGPMGKTLRLHFFETGGPDRDKLLYASEDAGGENDGALPEFERVTEMTLAGQRFQLGWRRGPKFPLPDKSPAVWVGASLAVATLFLAGLITSLQSIGHRANVIAADRTAELAASEERFRQAFESAGIGMALIGLDGRWLRVNNSLCETFGYSETKLLQKTFQSITHPDDLAADLAFMRELLEGRRRFYQLEKRYIHRDGHAIWVRFTVSLVRDAQGAPLHGIAQIEDITERKRLEANLASTRDQALEAWRLKSEFLATMIQEIRTPITHLIAPARSLRDTPLTPTQLDFVRTIEASGESLLTVSNDILDYSKIDTGQIQLELAPFDLRICVDEALGLFTTRARQKQIKLETAVAAQVPSHVIGDANRLRQILVNLVNNAVNATETGGVRVGVAAEALDATTGRQRLKFAVRDTGAGIPPDHLGRLFKSFSHVDISTRPFGGTALGLAISQRLAELMGGTMWVQTEPGLGSTFHFTILVEPRAAPTGP